MKLNQSLKLHGNLNRVIELDEAGIGENTIVGLFADNDIDITVNDVRSILRIKDTLTNKALPKSVVKQTIKSAKTINFPQQEAFA